VSVISSPLGAVSAQWFIMASTAELWKVIHTPRCAVRGQASVFTPRVIECPCLGGQRHLARTGAVRVRLSEWTGNCRGEWPMPAKFSVRATRFFDPQTPTQLRFMRS
jgi:hypothetical protein